MLLFKRNHAVWDIRNVINLRHLQSSLARYTYFHITNDIGMDQQPQNTPTPVGAPMSSSPAGSAPGSGSQHRTLMAAFAYLGILIIIPFLMAKNDPFVKFHMRQGVVLLIIEIAVWFLLSPFLWQLWMIWNLINLGTLVLLVIGIVNVVQGKEKDLPLIGSLAHSLPF